MIIDFGIAAFLEPDRNVTITAENAPLGSPAYMSPEQARGERDRITIQSDVWSLGATAFAVLLGRTPHDADTTQSTIDFLHRAGYDEPRDPRHLDPSLPRSLAAVLRKAVARDPSQRYRTAAEFADDLRRFLRREPVEAGRHSLWTRTVRVLHHHPIAATAAACLLIAVSSFVAITISVWYVHSRPHELYITEDLSEVRLLAVNGNLLESWDTETRGGAPCAELINRPAELGGGKLALIGFTTLQSKFAPAGIHAYLVGGSTTDPIWVGHLTDDDVPPHLLAMGRTSASINPSRIFVEDIFEENPGLEVIGVYLLGPFSQCALRIYDLKGKVLYQVWHDGNISDVYWMSGAGLLVVCGVNGEKRWDELGYTIKSQQHHPWVVYALRPEFGRIGRELIGSVPGKGPDAPVWYRYILPPEIHDWGTGSWLEGPTGVSDPEHHVTVGWDLSDAQGIRIGGVSWVMNQHGEEVPKSRVVSDDAKRERERDERFRGFLDAIHLGDRPPITNPIEDAEDSGDE